MNCAVTVKTYPAPPVNRREILRYAGVRGESPEADALLARCLAQAERALTYRACYAELPLQISGERCDFGAFSVQSRGLAKNLAGCAAAVIFAATVGVGLDRLIARTARVSPAEAAMLHAIGNERVESLCDALSAELAAHAVTRPRFSPGYGDLALETQHDLFAVLSCPKHIGVTLGAGLLMTPAKSVTAFIGVERWISEPF